METPEIADERSIQPRFRRLAIVLFLRFVVARFDKEFDMRVLPLLLSLIGLSLAGTAAQAEWRGFATADVNMRTGPGTGYSVIDVVPEGGRVFVGSCRGAWCAIGYRGEEGFVSRRYLEQTRLRDSAPQGEIYIEPDYDDTPYYDERRARRDGRRQIRRERRRRENRRLRRQRQFQDEIIVEREPRRNRRAREDRRQRRDGRRANRNQNVGAPRRNRAERDNRRVPNAQATSRRNKAVQRRAAKTAPRIVENPAGSPCPSNMICDDTGKVIDFAGK